MYGEHAAEYGDRLDEAFEPKMHEKYFMSNDNIDSLILGGISAKKIVKDYKLKLSDLNPYLPKLVLENLKRQKLRFII